jgi:hypothetical protein
MKMKFYYDQEFKDQHGANSVKVLDGISHLVQGFFSLPTLSKSIAIIATPHQEIPVSLNDGADDLTL